MAASTYKVLLYDIRTQEIYAEIPTSDIQYDYELDADGSATISFPLTATKVNGNQIKPADIFPVRTAVAIQRGSELVWGGLVWQYKVDLSNGFITMDAGGYFSYYKYRHTPTAGKRFRQTETVDIIKSFLLDINSRNGIQTNLSGLQQVDARRNKYWAPYEYVSIADVIVDMADEVLPARAWDLIWGFGGGFFFYFEPYFVNSTHIGNRMWNTLDRKPTYNGVTLVQSENCEFTELSVDGNSMANLSFVVGASGTDVSQTRHYEARNIALSWSLPYLEKVTSVSGEKEQSTLPMRAKSELTAASIPIIMPTAVTYPNAFSPKQFKPGDQIKVTTNDEFLELDQAEYVVTKVTVDVSSDGSDRISLDMIQAELFKDVDTADA
ncbi:hypothetical protein OV320_7866 [Actinobacteria bacterium OV320]|nr:hypothetical protein OV320_7866 [Actinobacteria bacterium OV320]